jgi:hypothetical protein
MIYRPLSDHLQELMYGQHLALSLTAAFSEAEPQALSLAA